MLSDRSAVLAVMAHPDDEFAIFPWLADAARAGRRVHCVWLTDGAFGAQSAQRRADESIRTLQQFGIAPDSMTFLGQLHGIPDGHLHEMLPLAVRELESLASRLPPPLQVLLPAWEGGHQDHDASHLAAIAASRSVAGAQLWQYSLYHGAGLRGPFFRVLSPLQQNGSTTTLPTTMAERASFVRACLGYRSQWKSFLGLLPFYALRLLRRDAFALQPVEPARTGERPHPGPMLYERRTHLTWSDFANATRDFRHH